MSNSNTLSAELSGKGLSQVQSAADIPVALTEAEAECAAFDREISLWADALPQYSEAVRVMRGRLVIVQDRLRLSRTLLVS